MDTTQDQELKKKEFEHTLGKPSRDNTTENSKNNGYFLNGEWIEMASDLRDLPEITYDDPEVRKWIEEIEAEWKERSPNLTHEELIKSVEGKIRKMRSPSA